MPDSLEIRTLCPHCGAHLDRAADLGGKDERRPAAGDFTLCIYCGEPSKFCEDMTLEKLTAEETEMIDPGFRSRAKLATLLLKAIKSMEQGPEKKPTIQ